MRIPAKLRQRETHKVITTHEVFFANQWWDWNEVLDVVDLADDAKDWKSSILVDNKSLAKALVDMQVLEKKSRSANLYFKGPKHRGFYDKLVSE